jgi:hypothetical protein
VSLSPLALATWKSGSGMINFDTALLQNTFVVSVGKVSLVSALQADTTYTI